MNAQQGDQIGRIFAHWVTVFYGHFLKTTEEAQIFGELVSTENVCTY
jgi:hypothetical protein